MSQKISCLRPSLSLVPTLASHERKLLHIIRYMHVPRLVMTCGMCGLYCNTILSLKLLIPCFTFLTMLFLKILRMTAH